MTTMQRTDIHRPSAVEFDPENYIVLGYADFHQTEGSRPVQTISRLVDQGWSFRGAPHGSGQCSHCGAHLRYAALMGHEPTKTLLYVGETCLDNRFSQTATEFARMRREAAAKAEQTRLVGRANMFYAEHPDMVWLTYAWNIGVAGGTEEWTTANTWGEVTFDTEEQANTWIAEREAQGHHQDYAVVGHKRGTTWSERTRMGDKVQVLHDMAHKVTRYGSLSDAQMAYATKILGWMTEAEERLVARKAETAAKIAEGVEVPEGRIVVECTVLSTKWVENGFGGALKMLVQHESGWKVWGTVPSNIDVDKDSKVRFTATVEKSDDDALFGFFKRPAKAEVL
jgi:hypothetical protein